MTFVPFDGVLLDDPRDPVPGAVALALHQQVERRLAARHRRTPMKGKVLQDRAAACQALLGQGLWPAQIRSLERHGLVLGAPSQPRSLASLVEHLEGYLEAVEASDYLEPMAALWKACDAQLAGQRGFWIERQAEDKALDAGIQDLAPPRLRALCALREMGTVRFRLATTRGVGACGLFAGQEPHLVRQWLPTLEALEGIEHLELEAPEGWGGCPWGAALDHLFEGPLEGVGEGLVRGLLPNPAAVWRAAVEQVCAWVAAGLAPSDITLVHPDPAQVGPLLGPWLAAEGVPLREVPGRCLADLAPWAHLRTLLAGLRDLDPAPLADGFASSAPTALGRSLRVLAGRLDRVDQTGEASLQQAFETLASGDRAWLKDRWAFLWGLRDKVQTMEGWLTDLEALAMRLEGVDEPGPFYAVLAMLTEAWRRDAAPLPLAAFLESLEGALEVLRGPEAPVAAGGVRLLSPAALESSWTGSRATVLMDLGEGVWPPSPAVNPELDWPRLKAINAALRAQAAAGEGLRDFPPHLQTFLLPQAEAQETLPRAFHREAYRFNRALALTREHLVALSAERDEDGQVRAQGPFWKALEGAGEWAPDPLRAASGGRWRWEGGAEDLLARSRQAALASGDAVPEDHTPGAWVRGQSAEAPVAPTLLEGLARCPFRVFAERELRLRSSEGLDTLSLHLGTLGHRLMEAWLTGLQGADHWPQAFLQRLGLDTPSPGSLLVDLQQRWHGGRERWLSDLDGLDDSERLRLELAVEALLPALAEVMAQDLGEEGPGKEELAFLGMAEGGVWRRELVSLEHRLEPRPLLLGSGRRLWVHGTLDRVERWSRGGDRFLRITDYKTSRYPRLSLYPPEALGARLQLPLYQLLLEEETGLRATAWLVSLRETGKPVAMMQDPDGQARLRANLDQLVGEAEAGRFPARPGDGCATCGFAALCGRPVDIPMADEGEVSE